jgi:hypothetical protein
VATIATFSIVACDLEAREWGVAVESKFLAVGAAVPFAEAETGAVATQARADLSYGPRGLDLLRRGLSADDVVASSSPEIRTGTTASSASSTARAGGELCRHVVPRLGRWHDRTAMPPKEHPHVGGTVLALARRFEDGGSAARGGFSLPQLLRRQVVIAGASSRRRCSSFAAEPDTEVRAIRSSISASTTIRRRSPSWSVSRIHQLLFGRTPREQWIEVDDDRSRDRDRLRSRGYVQTPLLEAFDAWVATENLEERADGIERIDPVVLAAPRKTSWTDRRASAPASVHAHSWIECGVADVDDDARSDDERGGENRCR